MSAGIGITTKETYRMACTSCMATRATDDVAEIHGVVPVFCQCGEIMVPEVFQKIGFFYTWKKKFQQPEPEKTGHVYLMRETGTNVYKIGVSRDVANRLKQISQKSGRRMEIVYATPNPFKGYHEAETKLLTKWDHIRTEGEWLETTEDQIVKIVADIIALEHGGEINQAEGQ